MLRIDDLNLTFKKYDSIKERVCYSNYGVLNFIMGFTWYPRLPEFFSVPLSFRRRQMKGFHVLK
jgi:hypothetical protein